MLSKLDSARNSQPLPFADYLLFSFWDGNTVISYSFVHRSLLNSDLFSIDPEYYQKNRKEKEKQVYVLFSQKSENRVKLYYKHQLRRKYRSV